MIYPRILIDTEKILTNTKVLVNLAKENNITVAGVTKGFCAEPRVVEALINGGVKYLADSRIKNLKKLIKFNIPIILSRIPMISEAEDVVQYSHISLNSEIETIKALSIAAAKLNKKHSVILMVDLGDLREGYFSEEELMKAAIEVDKLKNIKLTGIGTNLTCYGGVIPNKRLMDRLVRLKNQIEGELNIKLEIVSGGNSSIISMLGKESLHGINNIRLGEGIICGTESAFGKRIQGTFNDAFLLEAEVIEIKNKHSVPTEKIGRDAFGEIPTFIDRGVRKRIICGIGKQDTDFHTMYPIDQSLIILGGSSDHIILDASDSSVDYKIGDIIKFNLHYVSILRLMTSQYVEKIII